MIHAAIQPHHVALLMLVHHHLARVTTQLVRSALAWLGARLPRLPKVSVITPTWRRRDLLLSRCVPSVRAQTWPGPLKHIIVCDGPDPTLNGMPDVVFLPDHDDTAINRGLAARRRGAELASGELIAYLDDDNAWRPRHLELVVSALLCSGADFAYGRARCHDNGATWTIGQSPPSFAQVDTSMIVHRRELLNVATWEPSPGPADWFLVRRWLDSGASWAFVPQITLDYYYDARQSPEAVRG